MPEPPVPPQARVPSIAAAPVLTHSEPAAIVAAWCESERAERCQDHAAATYGAASYLPSLTHPERPEPAMALTPTGEDLDRLATLAAEAATTARQWHTHGRLSALARARMLADLRAQVALIPAGSPARRIGEQRLAAVTS